MGHRVWVFGRCGSLLGLGAVDRGGRCYYDHDLVISIDMRVGWVLHEMRFDVL